MGRPVLETLLTNIHAVHCSRDPLSLAAVEVNLPELLLHMSQRVMHAPIGCIRIETRIWQDVP